MLTFRVGTVSNPEEGDTIRVWEAGTETLVTGLTDGAGNALTNPVTVTADAKGFLSIEPPSSDRVDVYWDEVAYYLIASVNLRDSHIDAMDEAQVKQIAQKQAIIFG